MNSHTPNSVYTQVNCVRRHAGLWARRDHTLMLITGHDAAGWLQSQLTNDVAELHPGAGHSSALLDRHGRIQAHFSLHRWESVFWAVVEQDQTGKLLERLETHRFLEDIQIEDVGEGGGQIVIQGPRSFAWLSQLTDVPLPKGCFGCGPARVLGYEALVFRLSCTGEDGFVVVPRPDEADALSHELSERGAEHGIQAIESAAQEILRVESGVPRFGQDFDAGAVISETPFERTSVNYTKGCYLGQEVVARLKSYGTPKRMLMGLVFDGRDVPPVGPLAVSGRRVGHITSSVFSPTLDAPIALAYLDRDHRTPGTTLEFDTPRSARVAWLPFYDTLDTRERAGVLFEEALRFFEADTEDRDGRAIERLQAAVEMRPDFEDAYEALGVILHRHQRIDEAIHYMKILEQLRPDSVMAHANLSVFYLAKGMIAEAEEEKAKAALLERKHKADAREAGQAALAERARIEQEAHDRIRMFEEVLDIDPADPVATLGLGMAYMQLGRYGDAIAPLRTAIQSNKDYSAAYLNLGKCLEFTAQTSEARSVYRAGIEAAARKGDLMPLREMERRLDALQ